MQAEGARRLIRLGEENALHRGQLDAEREMSKLLAAGCYKAGTADVAPLP